MKFSEAMAALEDGKKVRCVEWLSDPLLPSEKVWIDKDTDWEGASDSYLHKCIRTEWELYEEPEQLLSFADVVKGLRERKKFKRKDWVNTRFIFSIVDGKLLHCSEPQLTAILNLEDYAATDWIEIK